MKIVVYETEQWEREACLRLFDKHQLTCLRVALNEDTVREYADAEVISTFVRSIANEGTLSCLPNLKLVATRSTGFDHIDLDYCTAHGIAVCNVPDYGDVTVAEHVFALLLAAVRHIVESSERTRRGDFSQGGLRGFELRGKTLGVIGTGRIGRRVIEIGRGFGMNVIACDLLQDAEAAIRLGFTYASLDDVLAAADIVTVHIPGVAGQRHVISDREFSLMRRGAVLINAARGSVVDVEALVRAVADERLRAVGLDVLPEEPVVRDEAEIFRASSERVFDLKSLVANHVILQFPNVVVTPHNAYNTDEAVHRLIETTVDNIEAFARGAPRNLVRTGSGQARK